MVIHDVGVATSPDILVVFEVHDSTLGVITQLRIQEFMNGGDHNGGGGVQKHVY